MSSRNQLQDIESIVQFSDESAKEAALDHCWKKIEKSVPGTLDFEALRICVRLLPPAVSTESAKNVSERLQQVILNYVSTNSGDEDSLFMLADICLSNAHFGCLVFDDITNYMLMVADPNSQDGSQEISYRGKSGSKEEHLQGLGAYYKFLKCSYWLPADQYHYITPQLKSLLLWSIGQSGLDAHAHDTLSALLALLSDSSVVVLDADALPDTWTESHPSSSKRILLPGILSDSFFDRLHDLPLDYFSEQAGRTFRTWFQWVSYMNTNGVRTDAVYLPKYWSALRMGLLAGFADQRKYCLGILQESLVLCLKNFEAAEMIFDVDQKETTMEQYRKYCTLFETIVLDRYPNQVQACLPELTALLGPGSLISPTWVTALLSAALNSKIQDGIRKLVGKWYLDYIISLPESCTDHTSFLVQGFLPWATQGNLFTSTLVSSRSSTTCTHGATLTDAIAKLVAAAPGPRACSDMDRYQYSSWDKNQPAVSRKQAIIRGVLGYVLDTGGKIFAPAVLSLLEGLLHGIRRSVILLDADEIDMIAAVSRLPALPEIAADLCRTYCAELCQCRDRRILGGEFLPAQAFLVKALENQQSGTTPESRTLQSTENVFHNLTTLNDFLDELDSSRHEIIQNDLFAPACAHITAILDTNTSDSILPNELLQILDAFWEEADRQDHPRPVAIKLAPLFFHPTCIRACIRQQEDGSERAGDLTAMLTKVLTSLHHFAEGRTYLVSVLATSLRKASFMHPDVLDVLPLDEFFIRFIENPPIPKKEFLFEVVAAEKLAEHLPQLNYGKHVPNRDYVSYYGPREWRGYSAVIDVLNRMPNDQLHIAKRVMDRLLEPWKTQKAPIPIISKWKNVLQLQMMLLLTESCIDEEDADGYLDSFMHALVLEPWPRYRYLLEWIITRIYFRFPGKTSRILDDLAQLDENSPVHIASLMKLALLAAPFVDSEEFALKLVVQLIPFSASPKVHVRHEAHWCFPTLIDLAKEKGWASIVENPAFMALDKHVRSLDKFNAPPSTIRTLKLDAVKDFTLTNIFQGRYLRLETPDMEYVAHEDFTSLYETDTPHAARYQASPPRVPLGDPLPATEFTVTVPEWKKHATEGTPAPAPDANPTFFQTKSGFDVAALLPPAGPLSAQHKRPASVVLVASLIDNPTNLGGLSRISESFGLEALYIDDLKKTAHKDFKATSVTSEKHFPIRELKGPAVPAFLVDMKRQGYEVVGIEQTDRSGTLGEAEGAKGTGTLPRKCVLVLGSERGGIAAEVLAVVDRCVEIRTVGVTRSLNVQTAGGIAVYEWWREWGGKVGG